MIKKLRKKFNMSQEDMAFIMGCGQSCVSKIELGQLSPTVNQLFRIYERGRCINKKALFKLVEFYGELSM